MLIIRYPFFFEKIKHEKWFKNTLFVITADHTGPKVGGESILDDYRIPIAFYKDNSSLIGKSDKIANKIDIVPSILHLLNYRHPFFS